MTWHGSKNLYWNRTFDNLSNCREEQKHCCKGSHDICKIDLGKQQIKEIKANVEINFACSYYFYTSIFNMYTIIITAFKFLFFPIAINYIFLVISNESLFFLLHHMIYFHYHSD